MCEQTVDLERLIDGVEFRVLRGFRGHPVPQQVAPNLDHGNFMRFTRVQQWSSESCHAHSAASSGLDRLTRNAAISPNEAPTHTTSSPSHIRNTKPGPNKQRV